MAKGSKSESMKQKSPKTIRWSLRGFLWMMVRMGGEMEVR